VPLFATPPAGYPEAILDDAEAVARLRERKAYSGT
jgi:hypothetical protein